MHTKRIIPCLDVNNNRVVKGVNFVNLRDAGDPVEVAKAYNKAGADELVFLDITASSDNRNTVVDMVRRVAEQVFIPFTVGGGIRTVDDFKTLLREGADKISINSSAIMNPRLISDAADKFGSQCVVVAIDAKRRADGSGWNIYKNGGRVDVGIDAVEWARKVDKLGAGEILLTSFFIYESCTISQYETHIQNLIDKGVSGFIIKNSGNIKNFNIKLDILKRLCIENEVALFELLRQNYYWDIIRYILDNVFDQEMALLKYHKVTNDNLKEYIFHKEATPKNIIELLYTIIDNPISMYYENLSCLATTYEEKSSFDLLDNIKEYSPEIRLRYNYLKQDAGKYNQYIIPITFIGNIPIKIVIDEKNRKLTNFDFVAIENAIDALRYSFTFDFAKNEIHKKYHRDIFFNLVNSQLNYDDTTEAAKMLNLKEDAYYRVVSFHSIPEDQKEKYSLEHLVMQVKLLYRQTKPESMKMLFLL